jgi:cell division protein FtsW
MHKTTKKIDRPILIVTLLLVIVGFFIFSSASLGLLARDGVQYSSVAFSQFFFGIIGGLLAMTLFANITYRAYRPYVPFLFVFALLLTVAVFIPHFGYEANGARRWLNIFGFSLQPAEILKISYVLFLAWFYSVHHKKLNDYRFALGGLLGSLGVVGVILLLQPDTGTFLILGATGVAMTFMAGIHRKHIAILGVVALLGVVVLAVSRPYLLERVTTFLNPASDPGGAGYQIKQSLIAVGSGGGFGRGYGQSVQKFSYLPEPIGDSIFSVAAEEFGFFGSLVLLGLFVTFALRGFYVAAQAPDRFGGLTIIGIVILIITQSFINIGSMIGLMPLTGEPLTFISHGGTSLFVTLAGVGILLNVSRYNKNQSIQV